MHSKAKFDMSLSIHVKTKLIAFINKFQRLFCYVYILFVSEVHAPHAVLAHVNAK